MYVHALKVRWGGGYGGRINRMKYESHLSVLQFHVQEVKVSENAELLLAGSVVQRVLSGSTLL